VDATADGQRSTASISRDLQLLLLYRWIQPANQPVSLAQYETMTYLKTGGFTASLYILLITGVSIIEERLTQLAFIVTY